MLNQKTLALALMLLVFYASADNCKIVSAGGLQLKTSLTGQTCTGTGTGPTECLSCCATIPGTCLSAFEQPKVFQCPTTHYRDAYTPTTWSKAATNAATFTANCCTKKKKCDIKCAPEMKKTKDYATKECAHKEEMDACKAAECCDFDKSKCFYRAGDCKDGYVEDRDKWAVAATKDTYHEKCCSAKITCDVTCPAGMKKKDQFATIKCKSREKGCQASECCEDDPLKCKSAKFNCNKDEVINDGKAIGVDGESQCCVKKTTCEAFKAAKLEVSQTTKQPNQPNNSQTTKQPNQPNNQEVSGAVKQQALAAAILLSMGGYLSIGK